MVRCPFCSYEREFKLLKMWGFRFYEVKRLECPDAAGYSTITRGQAPRAGVRARGKG